MRFLKTPGEKCLWITVHCHNRGRAGWGLPAAAGSPSWSSFGPVRRGRRGSWTPGLWRIYPGNSTRESRKVRCSVHVSGATPGHPLSPLTELRALTDFSWGPEGPSWSSVSLSTTHCPLPAWPPKDPSKTSSSWTPGLGTYRLHHLAGLSSGSPVTPALAQVTSSEDPSLTALKHHHKQPHHSQSCHLPNLP